MDGNTLEQMLVPEIGQVEPEPVPNQPAPAEPPASGQGAEPPAIAEPSGQGETTDPPAVDTIPKAQYDELRREFTKRSMELAQLKKAKPEPAQSYIQTQQQVQQVPQGQLQGNPIAALVQSLVQEQFAEMVAPIQQQQQDLRIQSKIDKLSENREFGDVAPAFLEILENQPELLDMENGIDLAYKAAQADYYAKLGTARVQAAQAASQQVTAQKIANNPVPGNAKPPAGPVDEAQAILNSIISVGGKSTIFG